jgi:hypothetical protein
VCWVTWVSKDHYRKAEMGDQNGILIGEDGYLFQQAFTKSLNC